jgi:hypothetical protein
VRLAPTDAHRVDPRVEQREHRQLGQQFGQLVPAVAHQRGAQAAQAQAGQHRHGVRPKRPVGADRRDALAAYRAHDLPGRSRAEDRGQPVEDVDRLAEAAAGPHVEGARHQVAPLLRFAAEATGHLGVCRALPDGAGQRAEVVEDDRLRPHR